MYQNCCKKCGSTNLHTEVKGNSIGLYCSDCGAWIKWLGKDELRAFQHSQTSKKETCCEHVVHTNADRIRSMTDEELAKLLNDAEVAGYCDSSITPKLKDGFNMDMLEWLQSESED